MNGFNFIVFYTEIPVGQSVDPNQTPRPAPSELGLHCLHIFNSKIV